MSPNDSSSLWNQLANVVAIASKQDQIAWTIFGIFWAANSILLVAIFTSGHLPLRPVGLVISAIGFLLSIVWFIIQRRAVNLLNYYEEIIKTLESEHLHIPTQVAISPRLNESLFDKTMKTAWIDKILDKFLYIFGRVRRIRRLMCTCAFLATLMWGSSFLLFFIDP